MFLNTGKPSSLTARINVKLWTIGLFVIASVISFGASKAASQVVCEPLPDSIPKLEEAKSLFANGDYEAFIDFASKEITEEAGANESFIEILTNRYPNGFSSCITTLSEARSKRLRVEMVAFEAKDAVPIYLLWYSMQTDRDWIIAKYHVSTEIIEIINIWQ